MNLIPSNIDERYTIYQIEKLDYITHDIANVQPQSLLNTMTYIYSNFTSNMSQYSSYIDDAVTGMGLIIDEAESALNEIESQEDVVDIVASYSALQQYDTSSLLSGDIIKVLADINYDNAPSFYKWNGSSFIFVDYEIDFPHGVISASSTINPVDDFTYTVAVSGITITLGTNSIPDGIAIHIVTLSNVTCTINYGNSSLTLYNNMACDFVFYNGNWYTDTQNYVYKQHSTGDIVISSSSSCPFSYGRWELLEEGCALVTGDNNTVTGNAVGSNSVTFTPVYNTVSGSTTITVAMLPQHRHIVYVSAASASHTHPYGMSTQSLAIGRAHKNTYGNNNTQGITSGSGDTGSHNHTITAYMGLSSVYSSSPTGHSHTISINDVTIPTMQSSIAYYAWKRVDTSYFITYDGNGNTSGTVPEVQEANDDNQYTVTVPQCDIVKDSHEFMGWNEDTTSQVVLYNEGDTISNISSNKTLHAVWKYLRQYDGVDDIDIVDIALFSQENWFKEFEVSFVIEDIDDNQPSGDKATFTACMYEVASPWQGFMIRMDGISNKQVVAGTYPVWGINNGLNRDTSNQQIKTTTPYVAAIEGHKITFKRTYIDSVLKVGFYIDDVLIGENDFTNSTYYTNVKLTFGGELDGNNTARRFCKCTLSNIKVIFDGNIIYQR